MTITIGRTEPTSPMTVARLGLVDCFQHDLFVPDMQATSKDAAFEEPVDRLVGVLGEHCRLTLLRKLHDRERLGTTGFGRGVAIPHARTTLTRELRIVFGRSRLGIDYDSRDQAPVHLIFLVVEPSQDRTHRRYLPTLAGIADLVRCTENRDRLLEARTFSEFLEAVSGCTEDVVP